jgi:polyisoprenoid-binding protein YceI
MKGIALTTFCALTLWLWPMRHTSAASETREIDSQHSTMTVRVYKSGFLSAFGHNHEIQAPIQSGQVKESGDASVELHIDARKLRVLDTDVSTDTRSKIQETMLGPQVLDADHFPEIFFQSARLEPKGPNHWVVHGKLALHGQERPIAVEVTLKDGSYRGSAALKQTDFGITPVTVAGGTVKVKDEIKIEFDIALTKLETHLAHGKYEDYKPTR